MRHKTATLVRVSMDFYGECFGDNNVFIPFVGFYVFLLQEGHILRRIIARDFCTFDANFIFTENVLIIH